MVLPGNKNGKRLISSVHAICYLQKSGTNNIVWYKHTHTHIHTFAHMYSYILSVLGLLRLTPINSQATLRLMTRSVNHWHYGTLAAWTGLAHVPTTHTHRHMHTHTQTHTHTHTHIHAHMPHAPMHTRTCAHTALTHICTYTHTCTHSHTW